MNSGWFHCASGTYNLIARQQSAAFTDSYTDETKDYAGFVTAKGSTISANATGKTVAVVTAWATGEYFIQNSGASKTFDPSNIRGVDVISEAWAMFENGTVDAVYVASSNADSFLQTGSNAELYEKSHFSSIGSRGIAYSCQPEFGDVVQALNDGLRKLKSTAEYTALCDRYPSIACDPNRMKWLNAKTSANPKAADHPAHRADIVIGTEADYDKFNYIDAGELKGFDIELTKAVCKAAGKVCAIITVPWQSVWPKG
jgi:ABC-type amino acid transport substrate-binding protein